MVYLSSFYVIFPKNSFQYHSLRMSNYAIIFYIALISNIQNFINDRLRQAAEKNEIKTNKQAFSWLKNLNIECSSHLQFISMYSDIVHNWTTPKHSTHTWNGSYLNYEKLISNSDTREFMPKLQIFYSNLYNPVKILSMLIFYAFV